MMHDVVDEIEVPFDGSVITVEAGEGGFVSINKSDPPFRGNGYMVDRGTMKNLAFAILRACEVSEQKETQQSKSANYQDTHGLFGSEATVFRRIGSDVEQLCQRVCKLEKALRKKRAKK